MNSMRSYRLTVFAWLAAACLSVVLATVASAEQVLVLYSLEAGRGPAAGELQGAGGPLLGGELGLFGTGYEALPNFNPFEESPDVWKEGEADGKWGEGAKLVGTGVTSPFFDGAFAEDADLYAALGRKFAAGERGLGTVSVQPVAISQLLRVTDRAEVSLSAVKLNITRVTVLAIADTTGDDAGRRLSVTSSQDGFSSPLASLDFDGVQSELSKLVFDWSSGDVSQVGLRLEAAGGPVDVAAVLIEGEGMGGSGGGGVPVVPVPAAAWAGMALLCGGGVVRTLRRRGRARRG